MAVLKALKSATAAVKRKARLAAREVALFLTEPPPPVSQTAARERDESVFQPRKY
jgi:hypothetical protein